MTSVPPLAITLDDILATEELVTRSARPADYCAESQALRSLTRLMTATPHIWFDQLVAIALELCQAGSAGVSLLETQADGTEQIRWIALAGSYAAHTGRALPRAATVCGTCLDRGQPQLCVSPHQYFTELQTIEPLMIEGLVVPLQTARGRVGTLWIASHVEHRQFDSEDVRLLTGLADLAVAALHLHDPVRPSETADHAFWGNHARLRLALTAAQMGDWSWDAATDRVMFSERAADIFGTSEEPHLTWTQLRDRLHEDDRERARLAVEEAIAHRSDYDIEYRVRHDNGSWRWVASRGLAHYDEFGQVLGMLGVVQDISQWKAAEDKIAALNRDLQNRVDELQTLFEVIPIGILITTAEPRQTRANPTFAQILGWPPDGHPPKRGTPHHQTYKVLRDGQELPPEETPLCYAAIHGVDVERAEVDIVREDGVVFNLFGYAAPLFDAQGQTRGAVGAFLDITERKQAEAEREQLLAQAQFACEQAEQANRVKDEFLAVLSHELRTPLNPILGWTKLLKDGRLDARKTAIALNTIERNAKLQTQLIEDLLDISRILQGKLSLQVSSVDLINPINAAIETVRLAADAKAIQFQVWSEPGGGCVMGDTNRLQQVMWNLLSNAVKFTPHGGQVEVRLEYVTSDRPATYSIAKITVTDTGRGISPTFLPYVFDYFRQADSSTTRKFGGLGLGLAIVQKIVELHGGSVQADSPGEGLGATFTVWLPLSSDTRCATPEPTEATEPVPQLQRLKHLRVLVVDDEEDSRELIRFILQEAGATVSVAASVDEALSSISSNQPDVLVSDIAMPKMDGYSLIRQLRTWNAAAGGTVPAIALTAYAGVNNQQQALEAGFQQHLSKPIDPDELVGAIAALRANIG